MSYVEVRRGQLSGFGGFGAIDFSGSAVWEDWLAGGRGDTAAGMRAANAIRAALGQLGYGNFTTGAAWGTSADKSGYGKFAQDQGIAAPTGMPVWWPSQVGLLKLQELTKAGGTPGGGPAQEFHTVDNVLVPGAAPGASGVSKASMGTLLGLGVAALVVVGGLAMLSKKKPTDSSAAA